MISSVPPALLADLRLALRGEIGAQALYARLARRVADRELAEVLSVFEADEREQIESARATLSALGGRAGDRGLRRRIVSAFLALATRLGALRFALRLCCESEERLARLYEAQARFLAETGQLRAARSCEALAGVKLRHARVLRTWVES